MSDGTKPSVEERLDIQELFAKYCWALNTGDVEGYLNCFTEDGFVYHNPPGEVKRGPAMRKMVNDIYNIQPHSYLGRQHHPNNFLLTKRPDGGIDAKVYCSITRYDQYWRTYHPLLLAHWEAKCAKQGGQWLFQELRVVFWDRETAPWVGDPSQRYVEPAGTMQPKR